MSVRHALVIAPVVAFATFASRAEEAPPHWAFRPIVRPPVPTVNDASWPRGAIDAFVLARLDAAGLRPSTEADRDGLVRRLSLDLRGLPPSVEELDRLAGVAIDDVADAFLASPHYGERMAQDWLDLARYGDTNGYHADSDRSMWLYRDYVIASFNANKPWDRFIVENMAGDLLPDATVETRIASGFHRCVTFNEEGGADPDEFHVAYAVDRTNTTGQVFLGITLGCAQCHDHKSDPISQDEYYRLYAFFNSVDGEIGAGGETGYHGKPLPPLLGVATPEHKARLERLDGEIERTTAAIRDARHAIETIDIDGPLAATAERWADARAGEPPAALPAREGLVLWLDAASFPATAADAALWPDASGLDHGAVAVGTPRRVDDAIGGRPVVRLDGRADFLRTRRGGEQLTADFTIALVARFRQLDGHQMAVMWGEEDRGKRRALWKAAGSNALSFNGYHADVVGREVYTADDAAIAFVSKGRADHRVRLSLDGRDGGEGQPALVEYAAAEITIGANNAGTELAAIDIAELVIWSRELSRSEEDAVGAYLASRYGIAGAFDAAPAEIRSIARKPRDDRTDDERRRLAVWYALEVDESTRSGLRGLEGRLAALRSERESAARDLPTTMVMVEMAERKPAYVLARGDFQAPGERVEPDVPAVFPRLPPDLPRNRLALARWLIDPAQPLVARVTANRLWKQLFGHGLVRTTGDFGVLGERPSHPELLDWLAAELIATGWDVKRLQRLIVRSAAYRQASTVSRGSLAVDPENRLLSRAPRFRQSAEEIRDGALAASGLLVREIGGPSVRPPQPAGYLSSIGKGWEESGGADRHRRGLYTFWRRTMLYPSFQIFDAPSREFCTSERPRTNTPLQALVTLNDPVFVEAARAFGRRILTVGGATDDARLAFAFRSVTARIPTDAERRVLHAALAEQRGEYRSRPDDARALADSAGDGADEAAAWVAVAGVLLNLDETITRE